MKSLYIEDLARQSTGGNVVLLGWLIGRRSHKNQVFLVVGDSTGTIQAVASATNLTKEVLNLVRGTPLESSIKLEGILTQSAHSERELEIQIRHFEIIGEASLPLSPRAHGRIDTLSSNNSQTDHLLRNRHLYIRNGHVMATLRFRSLLMSEIRRWFEAHRFVEITAPVLTQLPLYDDGSALAVELHDEQVFLTQCVGFYLESAVHAFERVYNIGPSFRGEESRSKRHLMEYWHIKAEVAFADLEDSINLVESLLRDVIQSCSPSARDVASVLGTESCFDGQSGPFPRISYREAVSLAKKLGSTIEFGTSLASSDEALLSKNFETPFWVVGIPRKIEPFPYMIDSLDPLVTRTADLIASHGYGELLGVAEKITDPAMLRERLTEKGKSDNLKYDWVGDLREYGCVSHIGFGMGVERLIRWLLGIPHVREAIPFPRMFRRKIYP